MPETYPWGRPGFAQPFISPHSLPGVLRDMKLDTRQKIYALAVTARFKRGTWNGCVMNQVADGATSSNQAAAYFGELPSTISRFIRAWDQTSAHIPSDQAATDCLVKALLDAGLVEKTEHNYEKVSIYRARIYTSEETRMVEMLRKEIEAGAFDQILSEMEEFCLV